MSTEPKAVVVDIQHFSTHDGPGIRTTVFLKGCSLRCQWCSNPEAISPRPQLGFNAQLCIGKADCGLCLPACPRQAVGVEDDGKIRVERQRCDDCLLCVAACPSRALYSFGRDMTVSEVLAEVEQDSVFYGESGGGLTLSGGECLLQPDFAVALLKEARGRGLNTAIETAGNVPWQSMERVLGHVDMVLHDYKLSDAEAHRHWTGAGNRQILDNFRRAYQTFPEVRFIARIPLVPGVNDDEAHIDAVLEHIAAYPNVVDLELLPYHGFGKNKYGFLGREYACADLPPPAAAKLARLRERIRQRLIGRAA